MLEIKRLSIKFEKNQILEDINIKFPNHKITCLIGKNGTGKSTILKSILGFIRTDTANIYLDNKPLSAYKRKEIAKKIAFLSQNKDIIADIDVKTLVEYGRYPFLKLFSKLSETDNLIVKEAMELTGIIHLEKRLVNTLSGGEAQRVWLAMCITQKPEILILDEPTTFLDVAYQLEILEIIKLLNERFGTTIIMVLHDINMVSRYSDYVYILDENKITCSGLVKDTITHDNLKKHFDVTGELIEGHFDDKPYFIVDKSIIENKKKIL